MTIDDKIINREVAKLSVLWSGKIDKYEYLISEEMLPFDQRRIIEQAKFTYSPLGKVLGKQWKTIEDQGKKEVEAIEEHGKQLVKYNAFPEKEKSIPVDK